MTEDDLWTEDDHVLVFFLHLRYCLDIQLISAKKIIVEAVIERPQFIEM